MCRGERNLTIKHYYIDRYRDGESAVHRLAPRAKLLTLLICIILLVSTPPTASASFLFYAGILLIVALFSRVPLTYLLSRLLLPLPFLVLMAASLPFVAEGNEVFRLPCGRLSMGVTDHGLMLFRGVVIKAGLAAFSISLCAATTPFPELLKAAGELRAPRIIIALLSFVYRYVFLFEDSFLRMRRAKAARTIAPGGRAELQALPSMAGSLLVRSFDRAERVYLAMCSRGFNGLPPPITVSSTGTRDYVTSGIVVTLFVLARLGGETI